MGMKMKNKILILGAFSLLLCAPLISEPAKKASRKAAAEEDVKEIQGKAKSLTLSMGISRTLEYPFDVGPIYITDPNLFDFRRIKEGEKDRKLLLVPKNAGTTDMTIHDAAGNPKLTYRVLVTREDLGQIMSQLEELLGDVEGINIRAVGTTILIDGDILLPKDMIRIMRVIDAIKERDPKKKEVPIRNIATISKTTMNIIGERIEKEIGSPEITVKALNNNIIMEGVAENDYEADRALEIARMYLPEVFVERNKGTVAVQSVLR
jgi:pilus assembly protein CpaC